MEIFKDSFNASRISGGKNNDIYNLFKVENKRKTVALKAASLEAREARNLPDKTLYNELTAKTNALSLELRNYSHEFIDQHADTDFALILLESMTRGRKPELERFKKNRLALNDIINKNNYNKALGAKVNDLIYQLEAQKNLDIGKIAPNFSSFTPEGKPLALNDIKGKATIIDFWAAWCGPCRRENPNVVKVYEKYHEKGLEIISISLDGTGRQKDPKAAWLKAVEDDKMNWHHVSSLSYFNDPVAKLYNITSIPATFILDAEGKIVAKRLRGDALEQQIAQMLN
jgi:thiol-disulfide isomerase/thioredoxin